MREHLEAPRAPRTIALALLAACLGGSGFAEPPSTPSGPVAVAPDDTDSDRRGPSEIRDEHVLAQPRLTLPAISARTLPSRRWRFTLATLWSNSFAWDQNVPGERPASRRYLIDAETLTMDAELRYGLRSGWEVGARLPLRWRGGGSMDGLIDFWHRIFGLPDGNRPDFRRNAFRVEGLTTNGSAGMDWTDRRGLGLGNAELETRWRLTPEPRRVQAALAARVALPTGSGAFAGHGAAVGLQLAASLPLGRRFDAYGGLGATLQDRGPVGGLEYRPRRWHAFGALEWRPWRSLSLVAETNAASRLVSNLQRYPGTHWLLDVTARRRLGQRAEVQVGFTENIASQLSTTDFAVFAAVSLRAGERRRERP